MSFTPRPYSGRHRRISRREDRHIIRHARVELTASLAAVRTLAAASLRAHVSSRTIARRQAEGHLVSRGPLRVLLMIPTHRCLRLEWYAHDRIGL
ncbi:HTH_Tnp_Tc3_2 domain-containing protein [Trichonephila clavipes]|nr:HTH_Tnp_Tc3_2 domain-containing protein [Trichonephila clavipes]